MQSAIRRPRRFTLMPLIALGTLSLAISIPTITNAHLTAASPKHYQTVTVQRGDDLWTLAAARTPVGGNVQDVVDRIIGDNRLQGGAITPGQRLKIAM